MPCQHDMWHQYTSVTSPLCLGWELQACKDQARHHRHPSMFEFCFCHPASSLWKPAWHGHFDVLRLYEVGLWLTVSWEELELFANRFFLQAFRIQWKVNLQEPPFKCFFAHCFFRDKQKLLYIGNIAERYPHVSSIVRLYLPHKNQCQNGGESSQSITGW